MSPRTALALLALLLPTLAAAADLPVPTAIDAVTVYPGTALVTRQGRAQLPAGPVRLVVEGLPIQLQDDSLRFEAKGSARARILGLSVENRRFAEATSAEVRAAEDAVRTLEQQDRALADRIEAANQQRQFLDGLRSTYVRERTENLAVRAVDTKEWASLVDFIGSRTNAVLGEVRTVENQRRDVARELEAARARLQQIQSKGQRQEKQVAIDLDVSRAGSLGIELAYFVGGTNWGPVWDARLDPARKRVDLGLQARIEQRTGEDWSNVKLSVSTAQPERRIYVPELQPRYLTKYQPQPYYGSRGGYAQKKSEAMAPAAPSAQNGAADMAEEEAYAELPPAQIDAGLLTTRFTAPDRATIPSTGETRKSFLASFPLEAKLERIAAPAVEPVAFLTATATNSSGVPLLAGPIELYVDDAFIGRTSINGVPAGDELKLAFGPDERIRVDRQVLERNHESSGVFSKSDVWRYRIRTTVENLYGEKVEVSLLDQLPVSREESIEVKLLDGTTGGSKEDENKPGVRTWKLELGPNQKKVVELRFEVSFPRGTKVQGLP